MARNSASFEDLCDSLYRSLYAHLCVPVLEEEQIDPVSNDTCIKETEQPGKCFFPVGTAEQVFRSDELEQLFNLVTISEQPPLTRTHTSTLITNIIERKLLPFLATLIYSRCRMKALRTFIHYLVANDTWSNADKAWSKLPVNNDARLRRTLGDDVTANTFINHQDLFCAAIIDTNQEVKHDFRRVPYVRERLIGQGSFGKIYRVVIAPQHFKEGQQLSNAKEMVIARKDFELNTHENAHEKERDVLREILRNATRNDNIMKNLGSLQIRSTYSLFMPLADCDLHTYMKMNPEPPGSWERKAKILQCAVGLAGAIVHLHTALESDKFEKLSCFHMDLKPQNILVFIDRETKEEQWKLSDFNMSRVKTKRKATDDHLRLHHRPDIHEFDKVFRRASDFSDASLTEPTFNRRGTGTFLAPEACIDGESVLAESDTWSLGCVISVVFTYLYGGATAVEEFTALRSRQGLDRFFAFSNANGPRKLRDAVLSDAVRKWFNELRRRTMQENQDEGHIFEDMITFLESKVLIIDPSKRRTTKAEHVRKNLIVAFKAYDDLPQGLVSPKQTKFLDRVATFVHHVLGQPEFEMHPHDWVIRLPNPVRACEFGPKAQLLVCVTDSVITAYSLDHICLTNNFRDLITCGTMTPDMNGRIWLSSVGVSREFIVAATDHVEFDCHIYHIPNPDSHTSKLEQLSHVELKLPSIHKVALSPDGEWVAFILHHPRRKDGNGTILIIRRDQLKPTQSTSSSFTGSSTSQSSGSSNNSFGDQIPLPAPAEDIRDLKFSAINALYAVVKPRLTSNIRENAMTILAWSHQDGKRLNLQPSKILHDGQDDLLQGLFTSFAPFNLGLAYLVVSQEKRVVVRSWVYDRFTQSKARGYRLTKVILEDDDRRVIAFGIHEANNNLRLLSFPAPSDGRNLEIIDVAKLPRMTPRSKFSASLCSPSGIAKLQPYVWIANIEGHSVRMIPVCRDAHGAYVC
ncbi:kinase-like domain-containing protein [Pyrenochaeta sp. MPI-SDFR-AT-0127]|nr:kinase-like domain-containing protein [Pyrenochaeta sp. MPI-SDFR-AT-0127]